MKLKRLSAALVAAGFATQGHAQLGQNLSVDIRSLALGNAVTADPPGVSSIHFNPAGLTQIQGLQTDVIGIAALFNIEREFSAPPGFNVFGYSDDPIVCNDLPDDGNNLCSDFKGKVVDKADGAGLFIPGFDSFLKFPEGLPLTTAANVGVAYRPPGSKAVYGTAVYAPLIAGFYETDSSDPSSFLGEKTALERITYLSPTISYDVTDTLSLGVSGGLSYTAFNLDTQLRLPNDLIGVLRLIDEEVCAPFRESQNIITDILLLGVCRAEESVGPFKRVGSLSLQLEQSASPSYNLGLLWEPTESFSFGMVYQSAGAMDLKGKFEVENGRGIQEIIRGLNSSVTGQIVLALLNFPSNIPDKESGLVALELDYPSHFQAGIKVKPTPDLQINFDVGCTDYDTWENFNFEFDRPISALQVAKLISPEVTSQTLDLPLGLQSSCSYGVGLEQRVSDRLVLRLGYEPRNSSIPEDKRNTLIPINNAQLFGTGIGYQFDPDTTIDLTAAYLRSRDSIPANSSSLANNTGVDNLIINPYAGLDIKTKTDIFFLGMAYRTRW